MVEALRRIGVRDARVLDAIGQVPRHAFVDAALASRAYEDVALPIGHGQTISKPSTVARMIELVVQSLPESRLASARVLEIGTGCGYQTAILCELGAKVYSIERHKPLYLSTKTRLSAMGYKAHLVHGDGYKGLPVHAPFNKVIVTCGAPEIPAALVDQLVAGGTLVIPVGGEGGQSMMSVVRTADGVRHTAHGAFSFVPMVENKVGG